MRIPPCRPLQELADAVAHAEEVGFDEAWLPDGPLLWRDVFAALALAATRTSKIRLGPGVANVETRDPSVIASAINTVNELAPGRTLLGLGIGGGSVKMIDKEPTRREDLRSAIRMIRTFLSGEEWPFHFAPAHLRDARGEVPIYLAVTGPKNTEFAGEIADGVILLSGVSPDLVERGLSLVHTGAKRMGRAPSEIDVSLGAFCKVIDGDSDFSIRQVKPLCCMMSLGRGAELLSLAGIELDKSRLQRLTETFDFGHAEDWSVAMDKADAVVSDEMAAEFANKFCFIGDPASIAARIAELCARGVTSYYIRQFGSYEVPVNLIDRFGSEVIPRVRRAETQSLGKPESERTATERS